MKTHPIRSLAALVASLSLIVPSVAIAQPAGDDPAGEGDDEVKPWDRKADGTLVSQEDKDTATALFEQGTGYLLDFNYTDAVTAFKQAIEYYGHPTIHYNLAVALANIAEPLEVYKEFEEALKYSGDGLEPEYYQDALEKSETLLKQLVRATVTCNQPDAQVVIDGEPSGKCADKTEHLMRAGQHTFTATKKDYETGAVTKVYMGGQVETINLKLIKPEDLTRYRRKFANWVPWVVTGAGVAISGVSGLLHVSARNDFRDYDHAINECGGCQPTQDLIDMKDGAGTKQSIAIVGYVIGASALVAGITLLVINRPQPYRVGAEEQPPPRAALVPTISREGVGVSAMIRF